MSNAGPTPEGQLLYRARTRQRPKLSIRKAATRAAVSESLWRSVEAGYTTPSAGVRIPKLAPADTYAHMAHAVGITPEEIEALDVTAPEDSKRLAEAAGILRDLLAREAIPSAGSLIRAARTRNGMSVADAARALQDAYPASDWVSADEWEAVERGAPASPEVIARLAAVSAVRPGDLEKAAGKPVADLLKQIISAALDGEPEPGDDAVWREITELRRENQELRRGLATVARMINALAAPKETRGSREAG